MVFRGSCLERGIDFINFCLKQGIITRPYVFINLQNPAFLPPCIWQVPPRYERQSKPWCPVGVLRKHDALGSRFRLRFRMLQLKTPVFCGL